ncbi:hypothetical protein M427DRAFT_146949 [Gonapodya prolifera JEL478]|uniref:Cell wall-active antibiotics response LiaF-like C-terminal domain-containing protein n=1 Tax=Gonapodya prolifera (strain JEL478) TaxID=1344416 RepID=A0A139A7M1_GONPJ|nr:hypothetical protein M427DRAFT_146949 [Gonapodya prolifera JEL478]|eukprot:KXS12694.1 hypothetical protein M427DRAFT_146949 [Gonapodya prolifera JEL478]
MNATAEDDFESPPPYTPQAHPTQLIFRTPRSLLTPPGQPPTEHPPNPLAPPSLQPDSALGQSAPIPSKTYAAILSGTSATFKGLVIPRRIVVLSLLGGVDLDLRGGILEPQVVTQIECCAILGGITVRAPLEFPIEINGFAILGGFSDVRGTQFDKKSIREPLLSESSLFPEQAQDASAVVTGFSLLGGVAVMT